MVERCRRGQGPGDAEPTPQELQAAGLVSSEHRLEDRGLFVPPADVGLEGVTALPPQGSERLRGELPAHRQAEEPQPEPCEWVA